MSDSNSYNPLVGEALPKIGIVGCGAIGGEIARAIESGELKYELASLCDINAERAHALKDTMARYSPSVDSLESLAASCEVIFEAAHPDAVESVIVACQGYKRTIVIMSAGGIPNISPMAFEKISKSKSKVLLPSGAMGGVDAILAMKEAGLESVSLTTTKPPKALGRSDEKRTVIFDGGADEAVKLFPKNINIAMTVRLAAGSEVPFAVRIVSDPEATGNTHSLEVVSKAGRATMTFENLPHPERAGTSFIAPMSAIALLRKISEEFSVGT